MRTDNILALTLAALVAGTALVAAMRAELSARDCEEVQINVDSVDTGARRFYERLGFVNVERAEDGPMLCYIGQVAR